MLRYGDGRDRVELEEAEPANGVEDAGRGAVQGLGADGDPAGLLDPHRPRSGRWRHNPSFVANVRSLRIPGAASV